MALTSVIIPTYNSAPYIAETITAILNQTLQDFEIVIVDDCSTDNTLDIIRSFNDGRIRIYTNDKNMGISYTHNKLIDLTTTDYIAIQDHDDLSYPYRLERQYHLLKANSALIAVASYPTYINQDGKPHLNPLARKIVRLLGLGNTELQGKEIFAGMLFKNIFCHSTVMLNKAQLKNIRYQLYGICDDYDLLIRIAAQNGIEIDDKPVLKYRMHEVNTSSVRYLERERDIDDIQSRYLAQLGIEPSADNLYLHNGYYNCSQRFQPSFNYLEKSTGWYQTIQQKNNEKKCFDPAALQKVIELNWFERCLALRSLGLPVFKTYLSQQFYPKQKLKKLAKSLILLCAIVFYKRTQKL